MIKFIGSAVFLEEIYSDTQDFHSTLILSFLLKMHEYSQY